MSLHRRVQAMAEAMAQQTHDMIERACEEAIQSGEHGVRVIIENGLPLSAEVHHSVPYGQIYYVPKGAEGWEAP